MSNGVTRDRLRIRFGQEMFVKCPLRRRMDRSINASLQFRVRVNRETRTVDRRFHLADELKALTRWK